MVSQKTAAKSTQYSDNITLVAEAIAGDCRHRKHLGHGYQGQRP